MFVKTHKITFVKKKKFYITVPLFQFTLIFINLYTVSLCNLFILQLKGDFVKRDDLDAKIAALAAKINDCRETHKATSSAGDDAVRPCVATKLLLKSFV